MGHVGHRFLRAKPARLVCGSCGSSFLSQSVLCKFQTVGHLWVICDDPQQTRMGLTFAGFVGHLLQKTKSRGLSVELQHTVVYKQHFFNFFVFNFT